MSNKNEDANRTRSFSLSQLPVGIHMSICAAGLLFFFLVYGVMQERIMSQGYIDDEGNETYFSYSAYLLLINRIMASSIAASILYFSGEGIKNTAPLAKYATVSFSNTISSFCQYQSLMFVSFPTQTLLKCLKSIAVLILGTTIAGKVYPMSDYVVSTCLSFGCAIFLLTGNIAAGRAEGEDSMKGLLLMVAYLSLDGFTSVSQEKIFSESKPTSYNLMLYVNLTSIAISLSGLTYRGELIPAIDFTMKHPDFFRDAIILSLCSTFGQSVIYYTIKTFGALFYSLVMTTRQVFSILLSTFSYGHSLTTEQWVGALVVFSALYYKASSKKKRPPPKQLPVTKGAANV